MSVLNIVNSFSLTARGMTLSGNQGLDTLNPADVLAITVLGNALVRPATILNNAAEVAWEAADDDPVNFKYLWYCADQDTWIQLITAGGQAVFLVPKLTPFVLPNGATGLFNAGTAQLDGTVAPVLVALSKVVIVNRSGQSTKTILAVVE